MSRYLISALLVFGAVAKDVWPAPMQKKDDKGKPGPGWSLKGRSAAGKARALEQFGGNKDSEAAVEMGLKWLVKNQAPGGHWAMDGAFADKGPTNDVAGTAFGLLPFLGAGHTHKAGAKNPHDKVVAKGVAFLIRKMDQRTGKLDSSMYAHALATIALCEAYGLSQDAVVRAAAQKGVNFIISAQHIAGGWRYAPGQAGDTSVTGFQVAALKAAQIAGLTVPEKSLRAAQGFLDSMCNVADEGYGYTGPTPTPTMSAVGLFCRQAIQGWGSNTARLIKGVDNHIRKLPPGRVQNMYYYYYATMVMYHLGGEGWKEWNEKMRDQLVKGQVEDGSWSSAGEPFGGGRLMKTALALVTLEVYYRYVPGDFRVMP